ncbi:hypothetical protein A2Z33_00760 [Candidatus Gottesmanbacteria bacterium RBG_16_52_11]|uniref:Uncharacterized protein n=1 Tax=Candidatus Gottesmanbacteria bacterium RBG_16_52_11 TaxID=1798374 RepID=A0A1F5YP19_9BACT|nr:MAG: hypothetical protein A2Z33_00760 [Candidatus Gottesmanbacteria bacterium RBG_16_52_11]
MADVLHVWPEYFDGVKNVWIPVDPTWANTTGGLNYFDKLDFNHIVFAVNGKNDDYPFPAGSYRTSQESGKIVDVEFADAGTANHIPGILDAEIRFPSNVIPGLSAAGKVIITNDSGVALDDINISVTSDPAGLTIKKTISHIPPLTREEISFNYVVPPVFSGGTALISVHVNDELTTHKFNILPFWYIIIGCTALGTILTLSARLLWKLFGKKYS